MARRFVIDANVTLGLFLRLPYSQEVENLLHDWQVEEASLAVPTLWEYECLTGFLRAVDLNLVSVEEAILMVEALYDLEFQHVPPSVELHRSALIWARRLGQAKIYDGLYLALAEFLSAEFWTADKRLFHNLRNLEIEWVHGIGIQKG